MSLLARFVAGAYAKLLSLYPRRFRNEFAVEMKDVFQRLVMEADRDGALALLRVSSREFLQIPISILREIWHELRREEIRMLHENIGQPPETTATTGQVILGSLPFLVFGLFLILLEIPIEWKRPAGFDTFGGLVFVLLLILPAIGFGVGWVQRFPRWSYPYAGMALVMALYIANVTTPGLSLLGIPIFGRELWGWRAFIPLATSFAAALAITRSFQPLRRLFTNLWGDWTLLSYLMVGLLPLLIAFQFDEIDQLYSLYFMVPFAVLLVGTVLLYLRSTSTWQRVLVLTIGVLAILVPSVLGSNSYWLEHKGMFVSTAGRMLIQTGKIAFIFLLPAWLELVRRLDSRPQAAR